MAERKVQVFFYGSYISMDVLGEAGMKRRAFAPATIQGFELTIQPMATLQEAGDGVVYGILANFTHEELDSLYRDNPDNFGGHVYLPEPVLVHTRGGKIVPAFTYICHDMEKARADAAYVARIQKTAKDYGFPAWYVDHIAKFGG